MSVIHIDGAELIAQLDAHGWTQGYWTDDDGRICAHQAIRLCSPKPGDAMLIERVADRQGWGPDWNDDESTPEADVRALLARGVDVTDEMLADTFGPQWRAVVRLVRRAAATLTADDVVRLDTAWDAAWGAARDAARRAARRAAARGAAWDAARGAAWDAARGAAARNAAWSAGWSAGWSAVGDAALAIATWDLATDDGHFTPADRDLLIEPWLTIDPGIADDIVEVAA